MPSFVPKGATRPPGRLSAASIASIAPIAPITSIASIASSVTLAAVLATMLLAAGVSPAQAQWQVSSPDGNSSLKLGFLLQGRAEWAENYEAAGDASGASREYTSQNLYLRRIRLVLGGKIRKDLSFFIDTDGPNSGKVGTSGGKEFGDIYLQDFVTTWDVAGPLKLDTGLILAPGAYNHLQSAASLLAMDYGPYTFVESGPLKTKVGRDTGVQARGVVLRKHVEYRVAVLQGLREAKGTDPFRLAARVAWSPFDGQSALFYPGTSLGKRLGITVGAAIDAQRDYRAYHGDLYADVPLTARHTLTGQIDVSRYDGGDLLASIRPQTTLLGEVGFGIASRFTPYFQAARQELDSRGPDETSLQAGLSWWIDGHKANFKAAWNRIERDGAKTRNQLLIQYQAFTF
ncbi:MAG: porin [Candidatus Eisenbacteria bacterium]|nr:porin [Candidatus Eisenbacteria bacterium]